MKTALLLILLAATLAAEDKANLTAAEVEALASIQQEIDLVTMQANAALSSLKSLQGKAAGKICAARELPLDKCKIDLPGKKATLAEDPKPEPKK